MDEVTEIKVHSLENQAMKKGPQNVRIECLLSPLGQRYFGKLIYNRLISSDHFIFFVLPLARQSTPSYVNNSPWGAPGHNVHSAQTDSHIELQSSLLVYLGLRESYKLSTHKGRPDY